MAGVWARLRSSSAGCLRFLRFCSTTTTTTVAVVASRRLLTLRLGCLWERKYAFRSFLPPSFSRARAIHPSPSEGGGRGNPGSWCTGGQTLVRSARAEENRGMHLRILPGNAAGVRNGAKRLSRKTRLPLELNLSGYVFTLRRCKASFCRFYLGW